MRKITQKSVDAFLHGRNMNAQNMCVSHHAGYSEMFLHGNMIATRHAGKVLVSLAGWPTATTRDRLSALCHAVDSPYSIEQRNHKQVLIDAKTLDIVREIDDYEWFGIN